MQLPHYLGLLHKAEENLAKAFDEVGHAHSDEVDIFYTTSKLAKECRAHVQKLQPFVDKYSEHADSEPDRLHSDLFTGSRSGPLGMLRDLHDLYLMVSEADITWTLLGQAAKGLRDADLLEVVTRCEGETAMQLAWLKTRMKTAAPQTLVVG